jgi:ATP/maltotriose-dependent transcriptional regulator MalT
MARNRSPLAKLTRPRLHQAVARERLFARLDRERASRSAICVVGPPGAGKTTLVASWLDARAVKGIWYQVDPGDADLSTFFYYLGEAARPFARKGQRPLPALTPEYLQDVAGFGRRFFHDLFAQLPAGACVVLDNYQEVPAEALFHQLVADAVPEVPPGASLLAVSRRDPPNCYARLIANDRVAFIDWDDLRMTLEETTAILAARGGWAAGLTLMLEGRRRSSGAAPDHSSERDALFDYFAAQIFEQVPEAIRQFLMLTALLPQVPASLARELTGEADAGGILEDLYQRHLFTHRRPGGEPTYWYLALFRGYLTAQGERLLSEAQRREHRRRAARLLEARGGFDDAFALFHAAQDWDAIARLAER